MNSVPSLLVVDNGWEPVGGSYDTNRLQSVSNFIYSGRVSSYQWNGPGFSQPPSPAPAFHAALRRPQPVTAELLGNRAASATGTASLSHAQGQPGEPAARLAHRDTLRLSTRDLLPFCRADASPQRAPLVRGARLPQTLIGYSSCHSVPGRPARVPRPRGAVHTAPHPDWSALLSAGLALPAAANRALSSLESILAGVVVRLFPR